MDGLLTHQRGSFQTTKDQLDLIQLPEQTDSYTPVSHYDLADKLSIIGQDILTDYTLADESYVLARNGNRLFAVLKFQNSNPDLAMSIGFRNSYDRSMSVGLAVGANVFVCDNMMFTGDIAVMKKHTKNVWGSLEDLAITTLYKSGRTFHQLVEDSDWMKRRVLSMDQGFRSMGELFGQGILSPRQMTAVKEEWVHPRHKEFEARNQWSFYNACTEALKSCAPNNIMERHIKLHDALRFGN